MSTYAIDIFLDGLVKAGSVVPVLVRLRHDRRASVRREGMLSRTAGGTYDRGDQRIVRVRVTQELVHGVQYYTLKQICSARL
jgi:hypothetical protein